MQENTQPPYCWAAENHIAICAQPCDNASITCRKGNEIIRCELYENGLKAFDNLNELWPFTRIIKHKGNAKQDARIAAKALVEVSRPAIR
jgi:hypothetical protein